MVILRFGFVLFLGFLRWLKAKVRRETFPYSGRKIGAPLTYLCTPFDCDINIHMNNSIYLRLMDLGRWHYTFQAGIMEYFLSNKMRPVAGRVDITFRKAIPPLVRFRLDTRLIAAKGKRVVFEQVFYRPRDNAVYAKAQVEVAILQERQTIETQQFQSWLQEPWKG